jgi:hypothetical protein
MTLHATDRANERLIEAGINPSTVLREADIIARTHRSMDLAVRMRVLDGTFGDRTEDVMVRGSNGDEVWAICRGGFVKTVMLRRSTQPKTPAAFDVDRVARIEVK